jgi:hypothetical protein
MEARSELNVINKDFTPKKSMKDIASPQTMSKKIFLPVCSQTAWQGKHPSSAWKNNTYCA